MLGIGDGTVNTERLRKKIGHVVCNEDTASKRSIFQKLPQPPRPHPLLACPPLWLAPLFRLLAEPRRLRPLRPSPLCPALTLVLASLEEEARGTMVSRLGAAAEQPTTQSALPRLRSILGLFCPCCFAGLVYQASEFSMSFSSCSAMQR
jgi:hypothetical protein